MLPSAATAPGAAFIDVDEFLVIMDDSPDLPSLLRDYEGYGGLAVNWRMFGSSEAGEVCHVHTLTPSLGLAAAGFWCLV